MNATWTFLEQHRSEIVLLVLLVFASLGAIQWLAWMFGFGRFNPSRGAGSGGTTAERPLRFVLARFFVEIINDFRHMLALLLVVLFGVLLLSATMPFMRSGDLASFKDGLQAVAAALGGLIGSIVGYYFGESAGSRKDASTQPSPPPATPPVQGSGPGSGQAGAPPVRSAPSPPPQDGPGGSARSAGAGRGGGQTT